MLGHIMQGDPEQDGETDAFVLSNGSLLQYPDNNLSLFRNALLPPLNLRTLGSRRRSWLQRPGQYEVAVKSLFLDVDFDNFPKLQQPYMYLAQWDEGEWPTGGKFCRLDSYVYKGSTSDRVTPLLLARRLNADLAAQAASRYPEVADVMAQLLNATRASSQMPGLPVLSEKLQEEQHEMATKRRQMQLFCASLTFRRRYGVSPWFSIRISDYDHIPNSEYRAVLFLDRTLCAALGFTGMLKSAFEPITERRLVQEHFAKQHPLALGSADIFEQLYGCHTFFGGRRSAGVDDETVEDDNDDEDHEDDQQEKEESVTADCITDGPGLTYRVLRAGEPARLDRGFPRTVNVVLPQTDGSPCSDLRSGSVSRVAYRAAIPGQKSDSYEFVPKRLRYLRLQGQHDLNQIEVRLQDEDGRQLQLLNGQPTVVQLSYRMARGLSGSRFLMLLRSQDSALHHPDNTPHDFCLSVPVQQFQPSASHWGVALDQITLPLDFLHLTTPTDERYIYLQGTDDPAVVDKIQFNYTHFASESQLVQLLNATLTSSKIAGFALQWKLNGSPASLSSLTGGTVTLPKELAYLLGEPPSPAHDRTSQVLIQLEKAGIERSFVHAPKLNRLMPHNVVVYASLIQPTLFAGDQHKVLKLLHIPRAKGTTQGEDYLTLESERLDFKELWQRELSVLRIWLRTLEGRPLQFWHPQNKQVSVILAFEQRHY